jgi:plastocyanin
VESKYVYSGIAVGMLLTLIGIIVFVNAYASPSMSPNNPHFKQMMTQEPHMMSQWMTSMMQNQTARQQMMQMMMNNSQFMQELMNNTEFQQKWNYPHMMEHWKMGPGMEQGMMNRGPMANYGTNLTASSSAVKTDQVTVPKDAWNPQLQTPYQPLRIEVQIGTNVTWTNQDNVVHTVTDVNNGFDSNLIYPGGNWSHIFDNEREYIYYCTIHPWMKGSVEAVDQISAVTVSNNTDTQSAMLARGNVAMGFDQNKIMHHFMATPTGGQIMIVAIDNNDSETISQIRSHILDIQQEFSQGNFTKPFFIHDQRVPGTEVMAQKKNLINYSVQNLHNGAVLTLTTNDIELMQAIQLFMSFQGTQHHGH